MTINPINDHTPIHGSALPSVGELAGSLGLIYEHHVPASDHPDVRIASWRVSLVLPCLLAGPRMFSPIVMAILGCWFAGIATAHDQIPGKPQATPIAIVGATIHPIDGADIENGYVLFIDGKICAIGTAENRELPKGTKRIEAAGKHVYPGLIAGMSDIGLREIATIQATVDTNELGPTNPNERAWVAVNPDSELIPVARANGVLTAMVAPTGESLQGQSAVMNLDGWTASEMIVKAPAGLCVEWESIEPSNPDNKARIESRERGIKALDKLFDDALRYEQAKDLGRDLVLESLLPVLHGELPLFVEANRRSTIESAVAYASSRQLKLVIYGGFDAVQCAKLLTVSHVPVILPGTFREPQYRHDAYDSPYTLPGRLRSAGVKFCISGEVSGYPGGATNLRNLPYQAAHAAAFGLPPQEALRAITLSAAEILGVDDRLGSLTIGKDATLMIVDGDILEVTSQVTQAWIQGRQIDLDDRHRTLYKKYQK